MMDFYDAETDSLYIGLADRASVESQEVSPGVVVDFDGEGRIVGLDIQHASRVVDPRRLRSADSPASSVARPAAV